MISREKMDKIVDAFGKKSEDYGFEEGEHPGKAYNNQDCAKDLTSEKLKASLHAHKYHIEMLAGWVRLQWRI